jgi:glycerol-3-phosphate dehydrogenase
VNYLLRAANATFPDARLTPDDVVSAWAGIRPLLPSGASAGAASREHAITRTEAGTIVITGGKLTTYRVMAEQVSDAVQRALGVPRSRTGTATRRLPDVGAFSDTRRAVEQELARTIGDVLIRRTHVAFETRDHGMHAASAVADEMGRLLGWDAAARERELTRYRAEIARIFTIDRG